MEYFSEKYGLVTDNDPESENGQLFLAHYSLVLDSLYPKKIDQIEYISERVKADVTLIRQLDNSCVETGLYHRNIDLSDKRIMSHDNMSGIMAWSFLRSTGHRFSIWNYLVKHLGTYDNSQGKSKQLSRFLPFNPSNFFVWGLCAESKLAYLFLPFYIPSLILACNRPKEDTSGKILAWIELSVLQDNFICRHLFKYYEKKMKKQYGEDYMKELINIYHGKNSKQFPLNNIYGLGV